MRKLIAVLFGAAAVARAQTIELRKVRTLIDSTGKAFGQAPYMATALPNGRYMVQENNTVPVVIDSTGRLFKRFVRGGGPGEFRSFARGMVTIGDTLYAGNGEQGINVYGPDLGFVRVFRPQSIYTARLIPIPGGFAVATQNYESPHSVLGVHIVNTSGDLVRSFVRDTVLPRQSPPSYSIAAASGGGLWVASIRSHVIEKWSIDGKRLSSFASTPDWFDTHRAGADGNFYVSGMAESDGVLWVISTVPVAKYRSIIAEAVKGRGNEVDPRLIPTHRLYTARLEAYDAKSGKLIADTPINSYLVALLGPGSFMTYSEGSDDQPRLEVWEMKLKRP